MKTIDAAGPVDAVHPKEALARMQTRQESAFEKLNARVDLEVARRFGPQAQDAPEKPGPTPSPTEDAWTIPRPVPPRPEMATRCPTLHPESSGVINDYAIKEDDARTSTNLNELLAAQHLVTLTAATKANAVPTRMEPESAHVVPAHKRPDAHSEGKVVTEREPRRGAQADAARRAKSARAKSIGRRERDASYPNPKYRGDPDSSESGASSGSSDPNSDSSESDASSGSSEPNSDSSDSSSFGGVIPETPAVVGSGETRFTFWPHVNATALEDFDEKASLG
ncbi:unnamed protein product [Phytophthora fragariaefolia]|uniref:Unnamed protein product n=1 Tax=Phytophthora fragariaefolia TaxID=1490495 RepID=A0A9W6Y1T7_9STRA|nr:unnamed protein product [Phytophthora fragariaefolia]